MHVNEFSLMVYENPVKYCEFSVSDIFFSVIFYLRFFLKIYGFSELFVIIHYAAHEVPLSLQYISPVYSVRPLHLLQKSPNT